MRGIRRFQSPRKRGGLLHSNRLLRDRKKALESFNPLANGAASFTRRGGHEGGPDCLWVSIPSQTGRPPSRRCLAERPRKTSPALVSIPSQTGRPPSPAPPPQRGRYDDPHRFQSPRKRGGLLHLDDRLAHAGLVDGVSIPSQTGRPPSRCGGRPARWPGRTSSFNPLANGAASFTALSAQGVSAKKIDEVSIPSQTGRPPSPGRKSPPPPTPCTSVSIPSQTGRPPSPVAAAPVEIASHQSVSIPSQTGRPPSHAEPPQQEAHSQPMGFNPLANGAASFT